MQDFYWFQKPPFSDFDLVFMINVTRSMGG